MAQDLAMRQKYLEIPITGSVVARLLECARQAADCMPNDNFPAHTVHCGRELARESIRSGAAVSPDFPPHSVFRQDQA